MIRQYRIIGQERFASKFCVLTRRGFEAILSYCKKSQQSQGSKFPQSAAAFIVRCCLKKIIRTCKRRNPHYRSFFLHILTRAANIVLHSLPCTPHASAAVSLCFLLIRRLRDTECDRRSRKMLHKFQPAVLCIFQAGCK